nr:MAG TPA: hypothetical protein [Crassvirales sp.]
MYTPTPISELLVISIPNPKAAELYTFLTLMS